MPNYTFRNKNTNEEYTLDMRISEREQYLIDNPDVQQIFGSLNIVDPVGAGITKPPSDFLKYVVSKAKNQPGANSNALEKRWHIPREW